MIRPAVPNTGIAVKGYPRSNTVASRNRNLSQEKAELASLIEIVVNDMIDQKCDVYTKKHTAHFREELIQLKQSLTKVIERIDSHTSEMEHRLESVEQQVKEARALAVNIRNGIKDEDHARMDAIELKLQSLAIDKSSKQEGESRDLRRYVKDFVKRIKIDLSNLEQEVNRVDGRVVHLNNTTNQRFLEHVDLLEAVEETVQKHDQYIHLNKLSSNGSKDVHSADHLLENMSIRLNTLGNALNMTGRQGQTNKLSERELFSPLHGTSTGRIGEDSLLYEESHLRADSISATPVPINDNQSINNTIGRVSTSQDDLHITGRGHSNINMSTMSTIEGRSVCQRLDAVESTLRSFKNLRSRVSNSENMAESYSKMFDELRALKSHVKHLGESTALACKHLTSGLTDIQEASIDTSQWAQQLTEYIDDFVNKVAPEHKQLCPKIKYTKYDSQHVKRYMDEEIDI